MVYRLERLELMLGLVIKAYTQIDKFLERQLSFNTAKAEISINPAARYHRL